VSDKSPVDWLAWWQLLRVANVFTAISNVIAGCLLTQPTEIAWLPLLMIVVSSACLYESGMVLNDVCDAEIDARERPERPLPSGRVGKSTARMAGIILMFCGVISALLASAVGGNWQAGAVAVLLAATIAAYDFGIKNTQFGPVCMGACRSMNILLGASLGVDLLQFSTCTAAWQYTLGIGIYTIGISVIAKREARTINRGELVVGIIAVFGGMATAASLPISIESASVNVFAWLALFAILFVILGIISYRLFDSRENPSLGSAVVALIQMFILLDAMAVALVRGWPAGLAVMCLYVPMRMLSRKTPMT
jgi:4-hydroxybenzoate polyprenyltransferase